MQFVKRTSFSAISSSNKPRFQKSMSFNPSIFSQPRQPMQMISSRSAFSQPRGNSWSSFGFIRSFKTFFYFFRTVQVELGLSWSSWGSSKPMKPLKPVFQQMKPVKPPTRSSVSTLNFIVSTMLKIIRPTYSEA